MLGKYYIPSIQPILSIKPHPIPLAGLKTETPMSNDCPVSCGAKCCRYVTIAIESPAKNKVNRDEARWFLLHQNIHLLREGKDWYVQVDAPCTQLTEDHRCGIYADRPQVCREYEADGCDHHGEPNEEQQLISTPEQWEEFLAQKKKGKKGKKV